MEWKVDPWMKDSFYQVQFRGIKFCWKKIVEFTEPNSVKILLMPLANFKYYLKDIEIKSWSLVKRFHGSSNFVENFTKSC